MALEKILKNSSGVPTGEYERIAGGTLWADSPIGTILAYGGASAPSGWFICNGSAISRTTYSELFAVIGTSFGTGDGSTTFNLPDMRESVPKGAGETGQTVGAHVKSGGLAVGEFLDDRVQNFSLNGNVTNAGDNAGRFVFGRADTGIVSVAISNLSPNDRSGATTEVKAVGVNYIIKAKQVALPADLEAQVEEYIDDNATSPISASNKLVTENTDYTSASSNRVDISSYTSSNQYTAPSDGYLIAKADSTGNGARCRAVADGAEVYAIQQVQSTSISQSLFVRKGAKLYVLEKTDQYCVVFFQPITVS